MTLSPVLINCSETVYCSAVYGFKQSGSYFAGSGACGCRERVTTGISTSDSGWSTVKQPELLHREAHITDWSSCCVGSISKPTISRRKINASSIITSIYVIQ
ncbi:hypothetical protein NQZ68_023226 [Dissostichus eleginoides]|nr:hypothetical protein NQZ68_023226 [Dissostichus eleginoides]